MWSSNFLVEVAIEIRSVPSCTEECGEKDPEKPCKLFNADMCFRCTFFY